jgi:organic hydroperoxide reductase OsmC/OhrA
VNTYTACYTLELQHVTGDDPITHASDNNKNILGVYQHHGMISGLNTHVLICN